MHKSIKVFHMGFASNRNNDTIGLDASSSIAVFDISFDVPLHIEDNPLLDTRRCSSPFLHEADSPACDGLIGSYGIARLICPSKRLVIESHPKTKPPFLKPFPYFVSYSYLPMLLMDPSLLERDPHRLRFALELSWAVHADSRMKVYKLSPTELSDCHLKLLLADEQDHLPTRSLKTPSNESVSLKIPFTSDDLEFLFTLTTEGGIKDVFSSIRRTSPDEVSLGIPEEVMATMSLIEELSFLGTKEELAETVTSEVSSSMQFLGAIKGLAKKPFAPIGSPLGRLIGSALGGSVFRPIAQMAVGGIINIFVLALEEALCESLILIISPPVTALSAATIISKFPRVLSDFVVSRASQMIDEMVNPMLKPLAQGAIGPSASVDTAVKIATAITKEMTPSLIKSVSQSVVGSLQHILSHSPLLDYYCYYCYHHELYCEYCSYAPQQLYNAMYRAAYSSSWYASQFTPDTLGVKIVRKKKAD